MHCNVLRFFDKRNLQYAALSIDDRACKLAISKDNASEDADDDWDVL